MGQICSQKVFEGTITYKIDLEGDFVSLMESYMPDSYDFSFKDNKTLLLINGGLLESIMGRILIDQGKSYIINDAERTVYGLSATNNPDEIDSTRQGPKITELDESENILGFNCKKYKMLFNEGGNEYTQYVWATKDIQVRFDGFSHGEVPGTFSFIGLDAFPLKIQSKISEAGFAFTMLLTATDINRTKLDQNDFILPVDYDKKDLSDMFGFPK